MQSIFTAKFVYCVGILNSELENQTQGWEAPFPFHTPFFSSPFLSCLSFSLWDLDSLHLRFLRPKFVFVTSAPLEKDGDFAIQESISVWSQGGVRRSQHGVRESSLDGTLEKRLSFLMVQP